MRIVFTRILLLVNTQKKIISLNTVLTFCFLTISSLVMAQTHFYIANRDGNNVKRYTMEGEFVEDFVTSGSGGLSSPQEVLFHPVDGSLLVTGFNNTAIKRYDGETGSYLGNFSSGYNLSSPTKMIIGSDSLLYVTQWGSTQNKIVRFDLDGNFVDEWSKVNVPEGCGMTFDADGNMYVTTWSNGQNNGTAGFVRKLDAEGNNKGIAISTASLQGPVGIWIGANKNLFVIDWTLGRVMEFDTSGSFLGNFISGMQRTEGNAKGPDGKYYLCDWLSNRVNRYNSDGSFDKMLVNSGLNTPNGIVFGPDGIVNKTEELENSISKISVYPSPSTDVVYVSFNTHDSAPIFLQVFTLQGKVVLQKELESHSDTNTISINISSLEKGIYHFSLSQKDNITKSSFVKF